jgi:hypothetical protein
MQQLSRASFDEVIEGNKHLALPRLSSQKFFEELCPEEYKAKNRRQVNCFGMPPDLIIYNNFL